jgi:GNAT superfamily N-acetyltransferase
MRASSATQAADIVELFPRRRRDRDLFTGLPFDLARSFPSWQPGIRRLNADIVHPGRNPFWRTHTGWFFAARQAGRVVGRMAVIQPGSIPQRPGAAVLAFPDFIDDEHVVSALLDAVCERACAQGASELIGPLNPDIHHDIGIQVSGFEHRNAVFMSYQPPYYARQLEAAGFLPLLDAQAWSLHHDTFLRAGRLRRLVDRVERRPELRIRSADVGRFDDELQIFFHLYSEAFADHWGFVRPTWDEFRFLASDLRYLLRQNLALIAEWDGKPVGFVVGVPDIYEILPHGSTGRLTIPFVLNLLRRWRSISLVRVMIAGVLPRYRRLGIHAPLFYRMADAIFDLGLHGGEISWVVQDNEGMAEALPLLGARPTKAYRLFTRDLS